MLKITSKHKYTTDFSYKMIVGSRLDVGTGWLDRQFDIFHEKPIRYYSTFTTVRRVNTPFEQELNVSGDVPMHLLVKFCDEAHFHADCGADLVSALDYMHIVMEGFKYWIDVDGSIEVEITSPDLFIMSMKALRKEWF